ncbi:head-tail adaptor protein [Oceanicella sp. SM1341]|uniref:phage head completion protein n=1 Tax=Oceanicella sp. SM1341 TaxID=1548889 RepID=UPI000E4B4CEC|nr:head-tail adaptor protein [Oceanicella sp. SM1341]
MSARLARLAFDRPTRSPAPGGGWLEGWQEVFTCRAGLSAATTPPESAELRERVSAGAVAAPVAGLVTVRAAAATRAVQDGWRIRDISRGAPGTVLTIREVPPALPGATSITLGVVWNAPGEAGS